MGIDPNYHERVFGLFNKLDAQVRRHRGGPGLGQAHHRSARRAHLGGIGGPGHGSTFLFTLPRPAVDSIAEQA